MSERGDLERLLGRPLREREAGTIASLNDVPDALVAQARSLDSPLLARALLAHYVDGGSRPYLKNFIEDVVFGPVAASVWRRGGVLVPDWSLVDQLCLPRAALIAPLGGVVEACVRPDLASWRAGVSWEGAPVRAAPDHDYRSAVPVNAAHLSSIERVPVGDLGIAIRRWIAARLARAAGASLPPDGAWSEDGLAARAGLARENAVFGAAVDAVPGFRSPDAWWMP